MMDKQGGEAWVAQVDIPLVLKVFESLDGSKDSSSMTSRLQSLTLQERIMLACLVHIIRKGPSKRVEVGKLLSGYKAILTKRNMKAEVESSCVGELV